MRSTECTSSYTAMHEGNAVGISSRCLRKERRPSDESVGEEFDYMFSYFNTMHESDKKTD